MFVRYSHEPDEEWEEVSLAKRANSIALSEIENPREIIPLKITYIFSMLCIILRPITISIEV
jgi:hypothetical protein